MSEAADRFRLVDEVFRAALREPVGSRGDFLDARCADDPGLRAEVEVLLGEDALAYGVLDEPVLGDALRLSGLGMGPAGLQEEAVPDRIGRYRIISRIGAGGMGTVYEAEQDNPRRQVAVKVINHGVATAWMLRRFQYEAHLLGRLQHPGIAQIYEAGVQETERGARPYFAMELVRGRPLLEFARERSLGTARRLGLVEQIADAVHHAHQRGVIHRDLKPSNVLVDDTGRARILDFGVARAVDADVQTTTARTDVGQLIGTVAYMSPEQAGGDPHELDTRSDVYALGVVAYELLADRLPYEVRGRSLHEAVRIIREDEPTPIGTVSRSLRGDVQTILTKALEKDKSRRYDSASALAEDVRRYLADQPIAARPPSAAYQLRKFARRNRVIVVAGSLLVAGLAAAAVFSAVQASRARDARELAKEEAKRALERFDDLRDLSKVLIFDVHDAIKDLPGATPAREKIVAEGLKYLEGLTHDAGSDRELLQDVIQGYTRIGEILGNPGADSLGKFPEGLKAYERGLELIGQLPAPASQQDHEWDAYAASRLQSDMANLLMYLGRAEEALGHAKKSCEVIRPLAARTPALAGTLATAISREVQVLTWMGRRREAIDVFKEAYSIDESLVKTVPAKFREIARRNFVSDTLQMADMHRQLDELEPAIDLYRKALAMAQELVDAGSTRTRRMRNAARLGLGKALTMSGDAAAALPELEAAHADMQAVFEEDPGNIRPLQDLLVVVQDLGDVERKLGHTDRALALYRDLVRVGKELQEKSPENINLVVSQAFGHERTGDMVIEKGQTEEGIKEYGSALDLAEQVVRKDPSVGMAHEILVTVNRKLGELWLDRADKPGSDEWRRAAGYFRAALSAMDDLESRSIVPREKSVDRKAISALLEKASNGAGNTDR